jgi:hypothetical protein
MVGRNDGNCRFRFLSAYGPPYAVDFDIMMSDDLREPDFKVGSVWSRVLPHLRQGNTLVPTGTFWVCPSGE